MILLQSGLDDKTAHLGSLILTVVNFVITIGAVLLVDRKGRKFLLSIGTAGVILSLLGVGAVFHRTEARQVDLQAEVQSLVEPSNQTLNLEMKSEATRKVIFRGATNAQEPQTLVVIYSYGGFNAATKVVRSDDLNGRLTIDRASCVPATPVAAFFKNPFVELAAARIAPLKIENALLTPVPSKQNGWLTAILIYCFMASFAIGPGVCVWLALSELMPTRIRSNGMSVALLLKSIVSTTIAAKFLPAAGRYGYSTMFFIFAGCTVVYFITATFFLPETKGKTLEEIEAHFAGKH